MMRSIGPDNKLRRQSKVRELLRTELPDIIKREVKDPRVRGLTVTEVDLKPDLKSATVYVCKFTEGEAKEPTAEEQELLVEGLSSASHFIYVQLKKRLFMKIVPSIRFRYDVRLAQVSEIWGLTARLRTSTPDGEVL